MDSAERAVADLLRALGRDPDGVHLADTPRRIAMAYDELLTPREFDLTTFPNDEGYDELVLARDIPLRSLCEHHLLPFPGSRTSATCRASASSACPSWRGWWSCSPAARRCRSG